MEAKAIVKAFYDSDLAKDETIIDTFHKDCILHWNSSQGYTKFDKNGIANMLSGVRDAYTSFNYRLSHLLEDDNTVTARYTIYVTPIESPELGEQPLAQFISIWEVKEGKLYKGYEISQLYDDSIGNEASYSEIKV